MKLTRLELSGFKSFADTVTLTFEQGVTAIVGPNGCGKSNVSDAVRWVLGEQSARLLRGGKMEDVIFQGSTARRPVNVTEVSLYLDNSDGDLPIAYREVVVTRRLSRSGQSDYLLNGSPVRLRDIQDLLRGTGLGSDAGVVIEAKMIDLLLSDRADERRSLFEAAAGLSSASSTATWPSRPSGWPTPRPAGSGRRRSAARWSSEPSRPQGSGTPRRPIGTPRPSSTSGSGKSWPGGPRPRRRCADG